MSGARALLVLAATLGAGAQTTTGPDPFPDRTSAFEAVFLDDGSSADAPDSAGVAAALDTLELSARRIVFAVFTGDTASLAAAGAAERRARARLDGAAREPAFLLGLSPDPLGRWLAAAHRERRLSWSRALLEDLPNRLPPPGIPDRSPFLFAVGVNALDLAEAARDVGDTARAVYADRLAEEALRASLEEPSPLRGEALYHLLGLAALRDDEDAALAVAESLAVTPGARIPWCRLHRARALLAAGRSEDAVVEVRLAAPTAQGPEVMAFLAEALLANDRPLEAAAVLENLIATYRRDPRAVEALATRLALGDSVPELALDAGARVRLLEPLLGVPESGAEDMVKAVADTASPGARDDANLLLGTFYYRAKRYEEAIPRLEAALESADTAVAEDARLHLARTYRNTGRPGPMERHYRRLARGTAYAADAVWELAREMASLGRWKDSASVYGEYAERFPDSARHAEAFFRRGVARVHRGRLAEALPDFRAALGGARTDADRERAAYWLARTLRDLDRPADAVNAARVAAANAEPADLYGILAREAFDLPERTEPLRPVGDLPWRPELPLAAFADSVNWPGATRAAFRRGLALAEMGEIEGAKLEWQAALGAGDDALLALAMSAAAYAAYPEGVWWADRAAARLPGGHPWIQGFRRLALPPAYHADVTAYAARHGLDPALVWAVMRQESLYDPLAVSRAGARGLLQVMPITLRDLADAEGVPAPPEQVLFDPVTNVALGIRHLSERLADYEGNTLAALASYNAGPEKTKEWMRLTGHGDDGVFVECIGYPETYGYVRRVPWLCWLYRRYYGAGVQAAGR